MEPLLFLLIIVLPGFISIAIIRELVFSEEKPNQFELTVWSGFISVLIYFFVFWILKIPSNVFEGNLGLKNKSMLFKIALSSFGLAIVIGIVFSYLLVRHKNYFTWLRDWIHKKRLEKESVWDIIIDGFDGSVIVHTSDGSLYYGYPTRFSKGKEKKELLLCNPYKIDKMDKERKPKKLGNTKAMLFLESDIRRIEFIPDKEFRFLCPDEEELKKIKFWGD